MGRLSAAGSYSGLDGGGQGSCCTVGKFTVRGGFGGGVDRENCKCFFQKYFLKKIIVLWDSEHLNFS